jgi:hypothetical protein
MIRKRKMIIDIDTAISIIQHMTHDHNSSLNLSILKTKGIDRDNMGEDEYVEALKALSDQDIEFILSQIEY